MQARRYPTVFRDIHDIHPQRDDTHQETSMSILRRHVMRANALYLGVASTGALHADVLGAAFGQGPLALVFAAAPHAAIGMLEAHGLALIVAVLFWRAASAPMWHSAALAVHLLLGGANLAFWPLFGRHGRSGRRHHRAARRVRAAAGLRTVRNLLLARHGAAPRALSAPRSWRH
jgi:hypothetical protein